MSVSGHCSGIAHEPVRRALHHQDINACQDLQPSRISVHLNIFHSWTDPTFNHTFCPDHHDIYRRRKRKQDHELQQEAKITNDMVLLLSVPKMINKLV